MTDCLEDWIRVPAPDDDVRIRMETLNDRVAGHGGGVPHLDGDGVLRFGQGWVALPPVEARLTRALLDRFGAVTHRDVLARAAWTDEPRPRNVLDVHVLRLRRRVDALGLTISTVRSRGYLMEPSAARQASVRKA